MNSAKLRYKKPGLQFQRDVIHGVLLPCLGTPMKHRNLGERPALLKVIITNLCVIAFAFALTIVAVALGFSQEDDIPHMLTGTIVYLLIVDIGWWIRGVW